MYIIVDSNMYQQSQEYNQSIENRIQSIFILINNVYLKVGIQFQIVCLELWSANQIDMTPEEYLLDEIKIYKRKSVNVMHDCLHVLVGSRYPFRKNGAAESQSMCSKSSCVGYTIDSMNNNIRDTAYTISHELAHNFGLKHDTSDCKCSTCIMATGIEISIRTLKWSRCSIFEFKSLLKIGFPSCLNSYSKIRVSSLKMVEEKFRRKDPFIRNSSINLSICGNGIVENGEDCDCGNIRQCEKCCNFLTCKLVNKAQCASGPCCDISLCRISLAGTICRNSTGFCDLTEFCDGSSETCSPDIYRQDGTSCITQHTQKAYCINGSCKSHQTQCQLLWGKTSNNSHSQCYKQNINENNGIKNCGVTLISNENQQSNSFMDLPTKSCTEKNFLCGRLWCEHDNEKIMQIGLSKSMSFTINSMHFCEGTRFELDWNNRDMGMVPDGAVCGDNMICQNKECVLVRNVYDENCHCFNNGICTNKKSCQCFPGYLPPNCSEKIAIPNTKSSIISHFQNYTILSFNKSEDITKNAIDVNQLWHTIESLRIALGIVSSLCIFLIIIIGVFRLKKIKQFFRSLFQNENTELIENISFSQIFIPKHLTKRTAQQRICCETKQLTSTETDEN